MYSRLCANSSLIIGALSAIATIMLDKSCISFAFIPSLITIALTIKNIIHPTTLDMSFIAKLEN